MMGSKGRAVNSPDRRAGGGAKPTVLAGPIVPRGRSQGVTPAVVDAATANRIDKGFDHN